MEADLQCSNAIQSMEKRLRAACNASDAKIDNVAKVIVDTMIFCQSITFWYLNLYNSDAHLLESNIHNLKHV